MKFLMIVLQIVRFPLDLVFLTWDSIFFFIGLCKATVARDGHHYSPVYDKGDWRNVDGKRYLRCMQTKKYGTPALLRLLYPGMKKIKDNYGKQIYAYPENGPYDLSIFRFVLVSTSMMILWVGSMIAVIHQIGPDEDLTFRQRLGYIKRALMKKRQGYSRTREVSSEDAAKSEEFVANAKRNMERSEYRAAELDFKNALKQNPNNVEALVGMGECKMNLQAQHEAKQLFTKAIELDESNEKARMFLAELAKKSRTWEIVVDHAGKALEVNPSNVQAHLLVAEAYRNINPRDYLRRQKVTLPSGTDEKEELFKETRDELFKLALEQAEDALKVEPENAEILLQVAELNLELKHADDAESYFRKVLELEENNSKAKIGLAKVLHSKEETEAAIKYLRELAEEDEEIVADAMIQLAEIHVSRKDYAKAIEVYKELAEKKKDHYNARVRLAQLLIITGQIDEGFNTAKEVLEDHPEDIAADLILAELFLARGFPSLAIEHCKKALAHGGRSLVTYKILIRAHLAKKEVGDAARELEKLLRVFPDNLELRLQLGSCYENLDKKEEAIEAYKIASEKNPDSDLPYVMMAQYHQKNDDVEKAIGNYRKALVKNSDSLMALNNLAVLLLEKKNDVEKAYEYASRGFEKHGRNAQVIDTLGWLEFKRKNYERAVELLVKAVRLSPRSAVIRYHLGEAFLARGMEKEAYRELGAALYLSRNFDEAPRAKELFDTLKTKFENEETAGS